jgi:hypothetical protein
MAHSDETVMWPVEEVPDNDRLFMRIHKNHLTNDDFLLMVFRNRGRGMSTDWEKYATPDQTKGRAKEPQDNAVISMVAGDVRRVPRQSIEHDPQPENRAHTEVAGEKDKKKNPEARVKFSRIWKWEIRP